MDQLPDEILWALPPGWVEPLSLTCRYWQERLYKEGWIAREYKQLYIGQQMSHSRSVESSLAASLADVAARRGNHRAFRATVTDDQSRLVKLIYNMAIYGRFGLVDAYLPRVERTPVTARDFVYYCLTLRDVKFADLLLKHDQLDVDEFVRRITRDSHWWAAAATLISRPCRDEHIAKFAQNMPVDRWAQFDCSRLTVDQHKIVLGGMLCGDAQAFLQHAARYASPALDPIADRGSASPAALNPIADRGSASPAALNPIEILTSTSNWVHNTECVVALRQHYGAQFPLRQLFCDAIRVYGCPLVALWPHRGDEFTPESALSYVMNHVKLFDSRFASYASRVDLPVFLQQHDLSTSSAEAATALAAAVELPVGPLYDCHARDKLVVTKILPANSRKLLTILLKMGHLTLIGPMVPALDKSDAALVWPHALCAGYDVLIKSLCTRGVDLSAENYAVTRYVPLSRLVTNPHFDHQNFMAAAAADPDLYRLLAHQWPEYTDRRALLRDAVRRGWARVVAAYLAHNTTDEPSPLWLAVAHDDYEMVMLCTTGLPRSYLCEIRFSALALDRFKMADYLQDCVSTY